MQQAKWIFAFLLTFSLLPLSAQERNELNLAQTGAPIGKSETSSPIPQEVLESLQKIQISLNQNDNENAFVELNRITAKYHKLKLSSLYLSLADEFDKRGDWRRSIAAYTQYLDQVISYQVIPVEEYWNIGWAYYMTGRPEKALEAGLKFSRVYPNNTQHNLNLALYYLTLGFELEAIHIYMWSFSVTLDSISLYLVALQDLEKAKDLFFYAYSKDRLERGWQQLKTLNFVQENL